MSKLRYSSLFRRRKATQLQHVLPRWTTWRRLLLTSLIGPVLWNLGMLVLPTSHNESYGPQTTSTATPATSIRVELIPLKVRFDSIDYNNDERIRDNIVARPIPKPLKYKHSTKGLLELTYKSRKEPNIYQEKDTDTTDNKDDQEEKWIDPYYNLDDDTTRNPDPTCRRTAWHRLYFPICNRFHEDVDWREYYEEWNLLGKGSYKEVYLINNHHRVVYKFLSRSRAVYDFTDQERMRKDVLVSERFTSHARIATTYGACGVGQLHAYAPHGTATSYAVPYERNIREKTAKMSLEELEVTQLNNLTASLKLKWALQMAEAVAALHGYADGVMVHDDVHLDQFLVVALEGDDQDDRRDDDYINCNLQLNDFNRAEVLLWNGQQYCRYRNGRGSGTWRSPEELHDHPLTEKIDIFSLGNNLYSLVTGMYPIYPSTRIKTIQNLIRNGTRPFLHPAWYRRSWQESLLLHIIEQCYELDPDKRIDIFEIVRLLRNATTKSAATH